jgi:O-antigen ligase
VSTLLPVFVVLPLLAAVLIAVCRDPLRYLLPAYIVTVPFGSKLSVPLPAPLDSLSTPLLILLILTAAFQVSLGARTKAPLSGTLPTWVLFLGWAALSAQWSLSAQLTSTGVFNLMALVLLFGVLSVVRVDAAVLRNTQIAIVASGALAGLYSLAQLLLLGGLPVGDAGARFGADILGANNTAAALLLPLAVALSGAVSAGRRAERLVNLAAAILIGVAIVLTGSRGGLLATVVVFVVIIAATPSGRRQLGLFGVVALTALVIVLATNPGDVGSRTDRTSSSGRTEIWLIAQEACQSYCLAGSGWATFPRVYQQTQPQVAESRVLVRGTAYEAHNIWIEAIIQVGLPGLVLLGLGLVLTFRDIRRLPQRLRAPPLAAFIGTMTASMFLSNFEYKFFWFVLTYVALCRSASYDIPGLDQPEPPPEPAREPLAVA